MERHILARRMSHHLKSARCIFEKHMVVYDVKHYAALLNYMTSAHCWSDKALCDGDRPALPSEGESPENDQISVTVPAEMKKVDMSDNILPEHSPGAVGSHSSKPSVTSILFPRRNRRKKIMSSMLHKAYINLKDKQLLRDQFSSKALTPLSAENSCGTCDQLDSSNMEMGNSHRFQTDSLRTADNRQNSEVEELPIYLQRITVKEHFNRTMYLKYQDPTPKEAKKLQAQFPDPEKLFYEVVRPMAEADAKCAPQMAITGHLQNRYWKAHLFLPWPCTIKVRGMHPDKNMAVKAAFLLMCDKLKDLGLITYDEDGSWRPLTCEKVVTMLETLSKYGESSLGSARGRGFKIILERSKEQIIQGKARATESKQEFWKVYYGRRISNLEEDVDSEQYKARLKALDTCVNFEQCLDIFTEPPGCDRTSKKLQLCSINNGSDLEHAFPITESLNCEKYASPQLIERCSDCLEPVQSTDAHRRGIPKWTCTVHVGWPSPFTVQAKGVSLPSAQMMGYMAVANKLKVHGLLTRCNNSVCWHSIEKLLFRHTLKHWEESLQKSWDRSVIEKFKADAELFTDASMKGFGAYLLLKDTKQISWLSEEWQEHKVNLSQMLIYNQRHLHSVLAELYAVVSAVFSWKHKLRGRRLMCFSDNQTAIGLINSFNSDPVKLDTCINSTDHVIHLLQSTCLNYNIQLHATWLDRDQNWLADCLSRNDVLAFQAAVPGAADNKTKAKKLEIRNKTCNI